MRSFKANVLINYNSLNWKPSKSRKGLLEAEFSHLPANGDEYISFTFCRLPDDDDQIGWEIAQHSYRGITFLPLLVRDGLMYDFSSGLWITHIDG